MDYGTVKWLHILSSTFLFGTGIGTAFYMLCASLSREPRIVYVVAKYVVIADWLFIAPAVVVQPITGFYLVYLAGSEFTSRWIVWSTALYLLAGACWLPVLWIQVRLRNMAQAADEQGAELPPRYWRYFRIWVLLGIPAFFGLVVVFYLMVTKPA
ncbi:MAG: DUF2269 domain-containing protein [Pseudomonadota bacterium]|nr:DUF2269 domain-containing protein [Pseudomonadota bacterium]